MTTLNNTNAHRLVWPDALKILAAIAIVIIHSSAKYFDTQPIISTSWQVANIYESLSRWAVPSFVMVSGMLLLNPAKEISIREVFTKYILRIVTVFIAWSLFYTFSRIAFLILTESAFTRQQWGSLLNNLIEGHYHMWYLYMLAGLYLIMPILRVITKYSSKQLLEYMFIVTFIFASIMPFGKFFIDSPLLAYCLDNIHFTFVTLYSFYFLLGYYLFAYTPTIKTHKVIYCLGVFACFITIFATSYISFYNGFAISKLYFALMPNIVLMSTALFLFAKQKLQQPGPKLTAIIALSAPLAFGVYLIHPFFLSIFLEFNIFNIVNIHSAISIPLLLTGTLVLSFGSIYLLYQIKVIRKYFL